ncbi:inner nuclear membrane protein enriched at telomere/subtelomere region [Exophiala dermatitidis]|uniref:Inner nuclear membrane protein enriched at telomere/subtelomere region n=1 Tax=Exophiala dermatitidis TaxID=5970 RepID=A0AAN6EKL7_EXODE|nr:inner nuclear membrane protein enriched at telomere/subtelomere region [Exophiala dermatitidis]KAJ4502258.1 inner nuclear membrane protein enriched at telomere/subtelomere region [Exophiala dermatitidis]KAJ4502773.1 inner nuclear membrane protein enriched at telomere/subtelomere region [Exophiala dermatitidis]KAJ4530361.1 inner nuclear membrane protein enriched at telomere/subtelomere region [Exophiala dermatitidis]KAJ4534252.1 inner nuclear membrane protein enriched at telomere/subtelomere 
MADEDELYYLQPGFDLNSLTIPKIRAILVSHNVPYPASAKKGQLLEILEQEVLPNSNKLLKAQARVRRTSKGITDVPSSQEGTVDGDDEDDRQLMPPPPAPKTPRSRKSKADLAGADSVAATPSTSLRPKSTSRRRTTRTPRASDTEPEIERSTRKPRKSVPAQPVLEPSVKIEEPDLGLKRESLESGASPFSDENPFQSGSSPPSGSNRRQSASRSRKSLTATSTKKTPGRRRQTTSPPVDSEVSGPTRSKSTRLSSGEREDSVPVTEEFTPDAARELAEAERNGQVLPARTSTLVRRKKKQPPSTIAKTAPWAVLTTVMAALGAWYRQEKINVGYCGVGEPSWSLASNPHIPSWVHESFQPACEPCPQHAICYPNMQVQCETDFVLKPHPLSLNGIVPLPPTCEPDSEKERRIKAVADRAIEELRERRAVYECGGDHITSSKKSAVTSSSPKASTQQPVTKTKLSKLEVDVEELKQTVSSARRKGLTPDEFEDLWRGALGDIMNRDEVTVTRDGSGKILLSSSSLARLPLACAVRRSVLRTITQHRVPLAVLMMVVSGLLYGRHKIIAYRQATAQIPGLVATTLDRLATQAALKEDGRASEAFISVSQLRDDVLRNVFSASERERVWQNVRKIVEGNANVRAATREGGKTGEWSRVWEWIGPLDLAPGLEGRRSGGGGLLTNGGLGGADGSGSTSSGRGGRDGVSALEEDRASLAVRKWDEGRPIY